jgi:hypothetical protein
MAVNNKAQLNAVTKRLLKYAQKDIPNAHRMAINRTLKKSKVALVKKVAEDTGIKQKIINQSKAAKKRVSVESATGGAKAKAAMLKFNTKGIPLINLKPKFIAGGVLASGYVVPDGFIASGRKGKGKGRLKQSHVLQRESDAQYPIKIVRVEIASVVKKNGLLTVRQTFGKEFQKEYNSAIKLLRSRT